MSFITKLKLIGVGFLVLLLVIQTIRIAIIKAKANRDIKRENNRSNELLAQATEIRDASYVKLNDENRVLKEQIEDLKNANSNLKAHIQGMSIKESSKEMQIVFSAIDKIKKDPKFCTIFMSFWPIAYDEAKKEYEDSTIGKKVFNFITLKQLRESNNTIDVKKIEKVEDKSL